MTARVRVALTAALCLVCASATAQSVSPQTWWITCNGDLCTIGGAPSHLPTSDADLDKAVAICDREREYGTPNTIPETITYTSGFEECWKVLDKWNHTEAARQEAKRLAGIAADKAFVEQYVRGFGK